MSQAESELLFIIQDMHPTIPDVALTREVDGRMFLNIWSGWADYDADSAGCFLTIGAELWAKLREAGKVDHDQYVSPDNDERNHEGQESAGEARLGIIRDLASMGECEGSSDLRAGRTADSRVDFTGPECAKKGSDGYIPTANHDIKRESVFICKGQLGAYKDVWASISTNREEVTFRFEREAVFYTASNQKFGAIIPSDVWAAMVGVAP